MQQTSHNLFWGGEPPTSTHLSAHCSRESGQSIVATILARAGVDATSHEIFQQSANDKSGGVKPSIAYSIGSSHSQLQKQPPNKAASPKSPLTPGPQLQTRPDPAKSNKAIHRICDTALSQSPQPQPFQSRSTPTKPRSQPRAPRKMTTPCQGEDVEGKAASVDPVGAEQTPAIPSSQGQVQTMATATVRKRKRVTVPLESKSDRLSKNPNLLDMSDKTPANTEPPPRKVRNKRKSNTTVGSSDSLVPVAGPLGPLVENVVTRSRPEPEPEPEPPEHTGNLAPLVVAKSRSSRKRKEAMTEISKSTKPTKTKRPRKLRSMIPEFHPNVVQGPPETADTCRVLSFDIGVRNLAYCLLRYDRSLSEPFDWQCLSIERWELVDILQDNGCQQTNSKKINRWKTLEYLSHSLEKRLDLIHCQPRFILLEQQMRKAPTNLVISMCIPLFYRHYLQWKRPDLVMPQVLFMAAKQKLVLKTLDNDQLIQPCDSPLLDEEGQLDLNDAQQQLLDSLQEQRQAFVKVRKQDRATAARKYKRRKDDSVQLCCERLKHSESLQVWLPAMTLCKGPLADKADAFNQAVTLLQIQCVKTKKIQGRKRVRKSGAPRTSTNALETPSGDPDTV